jgi:hypothetical protein
MRPLSAHSGRFRRHSRRGEVIEVRPRRSGSLRRPPIHDRPFRPTTVDSPPPRRDGPGSVGSGPAVGSSPAVGSRRLLGSRPAVDHRRPMTARGQPRTPIGPRQRHRPRRRRHTIPGRAGTNIRPIGTQHRSVSRGRHIRNRRSNRRHPDRPGHIARRHDRPTLHAVKRRVRDPRYVRRLRIGVRRPMPSQVRPGVRGLRRVHYSATRAERRSLDPSYARTVTFLSTVSW